MYESFGFRHWADGQLGFELLVPEYSRGERSKILGVRVVGNFRTAADGRLWLRNVAVAVVLAA